MNQRGYVYVVALSIVAFLTFAGASLLIGSATESNMSEYSRNQLAAFHLADAGVDQAAQNLRTPTDLTDDITTSTLPTGTFTLDAPVSLGSQTWNVVSHGFSVKDSTHQRNIEAVFQLTPQSIFQFAMFGYQWIDIGGSATTDSYDSCVSSYGSQTPGTKGDIGTNGTTAGSVDFDGTSLRINGTVAVGPNVSNPASIITNYDASLVTGNPKVASQGVALLKPTITIPPCQTALPPLVGGTRTFLTGTDYCPSNTQPITINGNAVWTATGPVNIYLTGELTITGNAVVGVADQPPMMKLYLTTSTKAPVINGDAKFYGSLYAPNVIAKINGHAEVFGSVVADKVELSGSGAKIHYDKCLSSGAGGPTGSYTAQLLSWREP